MNKEERCIYNAVYRVLNKERLAERRKKDRERIRVSDAAYYAAHKEEKNASCAAYRVAHLKERRAYDVAYRAANPEKMKVHKAARRALKAGALIGATAAQKAEIAAIYKRALGVPKIRCYLCGELIPLGKRHVDHILPLAKGGAHRPSNLAIACSLCNLKKGAKLPSEVGILL